MKITISTGTYPPEIGGSSDYSVHLLEEFRYHEGNASVVTYGFLRIFPTGFRHILYFFKLCFKAFDTDYIIALDIFSVAFPSIIFAKLFNKKVVVRVGGDFLWESFVERTHAPILLSQFYLAKQDYSLKELIIFKIIGFVLHSADRVVFSTDWQRQIMIKPYDLNLHKTSIIENFYSKLSINILDYDFSNKKVFFSASRDIFVKNKENLRKAFNLAKINYLEIHLDEKIVSHQEMLEKIKTSYAVIVASLSEVSPNLVFHAISNGIPVIMTKDTGVADRLKDLVIFVDPLSIGSIKDGIEMLLNSEVYNSYKNKIIQNNFTHSWKEIAEEFLALYKQI